MTDHYDRCVSIVVYGFAAVALTGCSEGWNAKHQEAREWLSKAAPDLKRAIILLRTCQPRRPSNYNNIWLEGNGGDKDAYCSFGNPSGLAELKSAMRRAGVIGISYSPSGSDKQAIPAASFILFREGLSVGGTSTSVEYHADPQPCSEQVANPNDNYQIDRRPLTAAPCRWFREHSKN